MELNQIPQNPNNWGNVADLLNENSGKIEAETAKLNNATTKFKGYFSTSTALSAKWPSPLVGDTAWVGETYPGVVYRCDVAGTWLATTDVPSVSTVNLSEYATQDAVSNEFASVRSDLNETTDKLTELESETIALIESSSIIKQTLVLSESQYLAQAGGGTAYIEKSNGFGMSEPFSVQKGQTIYLRAAGYFTAVVMIAQVVDGVYYWKVKSMDSNVNLYKYKAEENGEYVVSLSLGKHHACFIDKKISDYVELENEVKTNTQKVAKIEPIIEATKESIKLAELNPNYIRGKYLAPSGNNMAYIDTNSTFGYSEPIYLKKGQTIYFTAAGYLANVVMIAEFKDENYYIKVRSADSNIQTYQYTAENDGYFILSCNLEKEHLSYIVKDLLEYEVDAIKKVTTKEKITPKEDVGTYEGEKQAQVSGGGTASISSGTSAFSLVSYEVEPNDKLVIHCQASSDNKYGCGYILVDNSNVVIARYNNDITGVYDVVLDVSQYPNAYKVYANNNGVSSVTPTINKAQIDLVLNIDTPYCDLSLFRKVGVVGDSYASGELYFNGDYTDKYEISWGQIMARKHGFVCTNYSAGGLSTRTWLTSWAGLEKLNASDAEDLYLLALGINDQYKLGEPYLGNITDITSHNSMADYGDTFYGNYGRIIENIKAHAPNAKIVMFTCAADTELYRKFNNAIIDIANHYKIPYIVQMDDDFFDSAIYKNMAGGHPRALAYSGMAVAFDRLLTKCMMNNYNGYFADLFMY